MQARIHSQLSSLGLVGGGMGEPTVDRETACREQLRNLATWGAYVKSAAQVKTIWSFGNVCSMAVFEIRSEPCNATEVFVKPRIWGDLPSRVEG